MRLYTWTVLLMLLAAAAAAIPEVRVLAAPGDQALAAELQTETEAVLESWGGPLGPVPLTIILAEDRQEFARQAAGRNPEWAAALILERGRTILLDKTRFFQIEDRRRVLRHEIGHIILDRQPLRAELPRWFHEGFAQIFASEWEESDMGLLARTAWFGGGIPLAELRGNFPVSGPRARLAYAESQAAVMWLWHDAERWSALLDDMALGLPLERAVQRRYELEGRGFEDYFDEVILKGYRRAGFVWGGIPLVSVMLLLFLIAVLRRYLRRPPEEPDPAGLDEQAAWLDGGRGLGGGRRGRLGPRRPPRRPTGRPH